MVRKLIRCGWLVSLDKAIGDLKDAELLIDDNRIVAVGRSLGAAADETIDAGRMIVMPGLVNSHMHLWQTALRGIGTEWLMQHYMKNVHGNLASLFGPEDNYVSVLIGALNQINNGVTTVYDFCHNLRSLEMAERSADALEDSGIRAVFGHGPAKRPPGPGEAHFSTIPQPREQVESLRRTHFASDGRRVNMALALLGVTLATREVTIADFKLARELGLLTTAHMSRAQKDYEWKGGLFELAKLDLLGPDHNMSHGNHMTDEEVKLAVDHGATISSTVLVETRGSGWPRPVAGRLRALGVLPALGNDTEVEVSGDMFDEMRGAYYNNRREVFADNAARGGSPFSEVPVKAREALEWATLGGARTMMMEKDIGSISVGKKADIICLRADDLNLFPITEPVFTIVDHASGENVDTVMIDGQIVKRGGKLIFAADVLANRKGQLETIRERVLRTGGVDVRAA